MTTLDKLKKNTPLQVLIVGAIAMIAAVALIDVRAAQMDCARGIRSACTLTITNQLFETVSHDIPAEDLYEARVMTETGRYRSGGSTRTSTCYRAELVTHSGPSYPLTNCEIGFKEVDKVAAPINDFIVKDTTTSASVSYSPYANARFIIWFGGGLLMTVGGGYFAFRKKPARKKKSKKKAEAADEAA